MKQFTRYLVAISLLTFATSIFAWTDTEVKESNGKETDTEVQKRLRFEHGVAALNFDNDFLARPATDQNYTMGLSYTYATESKESWIDSDPFIYLLDGMNAIALPDSIGDLSQGDSRRRKFVLQDDAFTPGCLNTAAICQSLGRPINKDRPYANLAWTGVGISKEVNGTIVTTEFDFGIYGTNIGNVTQTEIHQWCCKEKIPQEWDTQIGKGGAPTFLYKQTYSNVLNLDASFMRLNYSYGYWIGWNTWPTVGLSMKCCFMDALTDGTSMKFWTGGWWKDRIRLEYDASYVLYNQSLQGAWGGTNAIRYSHSQLSPVVTLMHFHLDVWKPENDREGRGFTVKYSQNWKSRELRYANVESKHRWGSITAIWTSTWDHL